MVLDTSSSEGPLGFEGTLVVLREAWSARRCTTNLESLFLEPTGGKSPSDGVLGIGGFVALGAADCDIEKGRSSLSSREGIYGTA